MLSAKRMGGAWAGARCGRGLRLCSGKCGAPGDLREARFPLLTSRGKHHLRLGTSKEYDLILYLLPWKQDENRPNHLPTGNNRLEKSDDKVDENFNLICLNKTRNRWFEKTA